jgi:isochorismate synthase
MKEIGKLSLQDSINESIKKRLPFVFYRLPNNNQVHFIGQSKAENSGTGFLFAPFQENKQSLRHFISADISFSGSVDDYKGVTFRIEDVCGKDSSNVQASKEQFCKQVEKAVSEIKLGKLDKVILSRVEEVKVETEPLEIFIDLCKKYNSAFVSLVVIPDEMVWITASPELLVSLDSDKIKTVALAGTKPTNGNSYWGEKEKAEQQMVTDYVRTVLQKHCIDIDASEPKDSIAGNVMHLKTEFSAILKSDLQELINNLHPTPAVCGAPKNAALQFINNTELHNRKYYAGYLGPYNMNSKTDLFVNLRCAELYTDKADLFIGGGITVGSEPEKEWNETVLKSQTLLSVMNQKVKAV